MFAILFALSSLAPGATLGTDNAASPAYNPSGSGSFNGEDGGAPTFGPWSITTSSPGATTAGAFIGDSTVLAPNNSGGNVNTSGVSFGLYGYDGVYVNAVRYFDSPLAPGQTFVMQIAVNYRNGNKGFNLIDASGNNIFDLNIGGDDYSVNNSGIPNGTTNLFNMAYDANTVFTVYLTPSSISPAAPGRSSAAEGWTELNRVLPRTAMLASPLASKFMMERPPTVGFRRTTSFSTTSPSSPSHPASRSYSSR